MVKIKCIFIFIFGKKRHFSQKYLKWLDTIRKTPNEKIMEELLEKLKLTYTHAYKNFLSKERTLIKLEETIKKIKFVFNSELPPIEFSENPSELRYNKKNLAQYNKK